MGEIMSAEDISVKKRRMNIATALNSRYMRYAYVMLTSLFENQPKDMEIHLYILHSDLTESDRKCLEELAADCAGTICWLLIGKERALFSDFRITGAWTPEAYYRLMLPDLLSADVERLLYLDVDIIVNRSLEEFYFTDFEGNMICACRDISRAPFGDKRDEIFREQIQKGFTYFCSGVILLNIEEIRKKYSFRDYLNLAERLNFQMVAPDQDLLNDMHWREVKIVDFRRYDLFAWTAYTNGIHYEQVRQQSAVVHFSGPKPWSGKEIHYDIEQLWWDYAKLTPFYYEFLEECVYEAMHDPGIYAQMTLLRSQNQSLSEGLVKATELCESLYAMTRSGKEEELHKEELQMERKETDQNKIAFIICVDNTLYYEECVWYINQLYVPSGHEIDIICISEAESMAQGYNAAMKDSDAKYKVYLHQDVFIYNRHFIEDMLEIFRSDEKIGLMGMIGGVDLPQNAVIWDAWNVGSTYGCSYMSAFRLKGERDQEGKYTEAEAVDGMLMATQYDLEWREDLKLGWDFYDISQSLEFRRKGYRVVVPSQKEPWCMHDCGYSKLARYDEARAHILKEYSDYFSEEFQTEYNPDFGEIQGKLFQLLKKYLEERKFDEAAAVGNEVKDKDINDKNLQSALNILEIYSVEKNRGSKAESFFSDVQVWEEMRDKYDEIKFIVRHAENGTNDQAVEALKARIACRELSREAVAVVIGHSAVDKDRAIKRLLSLY